MAKRKFNQKARTLEPAVMKLHFQVSENASNVLISLSKATSQLNRRFMRQGLNWSVANLRITQLPALTLSAGSTGYVSTIPHTWPVAMAWKTGYLAWKNQQDDALAESDSESAVARFRDFKISMETASLITTRIDPISIGLQGAPGPLTTGIQVNGTVAPSEEWELSEIVIPNDGGTIGNTVEYALHMVGPSSPASKGLIAGYEDSRAFPTSPDPDTPAVEVSWLSEMHDRGGDLGEIVTNARVENDELPYDQENYPGGSGNLIYLESQGYYHNTNTIGRNVYNTGPFTAPCGLIRLDFAGQSTPAGASPYNFVTVTLVPGTHRGYLAESMGDF
jgi:hypothetical protein